MTQTPEEGMVGINGKGNFDLTRIEFSKKNVHLNSMQKGQNY